MLRTVLNRTFKEFSFEIYYLDDHTNIQHIGNANCEDIIYVRCYPKWNMGEQELRKSIEDNRVLLFKKMEEIVDGHNLFYGYFDIDFTVLKRTTTKIVDNEVCWIEARPDIRKKDIDGNPKGFVKAGELPPEN